VRRRRSVARNVSPRPSGAPGEASDLLTLAVIRLLLNGWRAGVGIPGIVPEEERPLSRTRAARSETLLSPPHRASMSTAGGAQRPLAKEDEHG